MKDPASFEEFWPEYLAAHSNPTTRTLHVGGTAVGLGCTALAVLTRSPRLALAGLLAGYGAAWTSHALVEGNKPKALSHPAWSLRGDLRMLRLALEGKLDEEAEKVHARRPVTQQTRVAG